MNASSLRTLVSQTVSPTVSPTMVPTPTVVPPIATITPHLHSLPPASAPLPSFTGFQLATIAPMSQRGLTLPIIAFTTIFAAVFCLFIALR
jgi:hypothetical protein